MPSVMKQRNSSMEILRIVAMFLIIFSHYGAHGTGLTNDGSINGMIIAWTKTGTIGVDIFVLLSGYYLINSNLKIKKIFTLLFQVLFYSLGLLAFCSIFSIYDFSIKEIIFSVFPTTFSLYWFFTAYIVMYALSPFINKLLNSVSRGTHLKIIAVTAGLWIVLPTFTTEYFYGNELTLFVTLYTIGAYLRKYPENLLTKKHNDIIIVIISSLFLAATVVISAKVLPFIEGISAYFYQRHSLFVVLLSVGLISFFSKIKPFYSKALNTIASTTFGIYLIHDNDFFRVYMWRNLLHADKYSETNMLLGHLLLCSVIVFAGCAVIEFIRKKVVEKPVLKLYDKVYDKVSPKLLELNKKIFG